MIRKSRDSLQFLLSRGEKRDAGRRGRSSPRRGAVASGGAGCHQRCEKTRAGSEGVGASDQHESGHLSEPDYAGGSAILRGTVGRWFRHRWQPTR